tara:strand:- start:902 stop:2407 length:1506 start_codon:yes stop_codon:yes gene_type:complete
MGLSFEQKPVDTADKVPVITNWNPVIGYMLYEDTISGLFYYKLVLEVYSELGTTASMLVAKIRQRRNGYPADNNGATQRARAFFDLRSIVNTLLIDTVNDQNTASAPYKSIHGLGGNVVAKIYSHNGDSSQFYGDNTTTKTQIIGVRVKGYQNYSNSANTSPTDDETDAVTDDLYYMAASLPLETVRDSDLSYIQGTAFQPYQGSNATDLFLSDCEATTDENFSNVIRNYVHEDDYHTIAFLNDATLFQSDIDWIGVRYYDSSGAAIGNAQYIANTNANGGATPNSEVNTNPERLLYFGCGPNNLESSTVNAFSSAGTVSGGAKPSNFSGWSYYTIAGYNGSFAQMTKLYYFCNQSSSCKGYKIRRLAWRNSLGCYDYFNFNKKSSQTVKVERNTYSTLLGNYSDEKYTYENLGRGKNTRQTTAMLEETLNTDWVTEQDANLLENLIKSTNVNIISNADTTYSTPVMVTDSTFARKTQANDGVKIRYTIKIQYANPLNTNS